VKPSWELLVTHCKKKNAPQVKEEEGSLVLRPRRSYDRNITAPPGEENRRSFENGAPKYFYPATPEEEVARGLPSPMPFVSGLITYNSHVGGAETKPPRLWLQFFVTKRNVG